MVDICVVCMHEVGRHQQPTKGWKYVPTASAMLQLNEL